MIERRTLKVAVGLPAAVKDRIRELKRLFELHTERKSEVYGGWFFHRGGIKQGSGSGDWDRRVREDDEHRSGISESGSGRCPG